MVNGFAASVHTVPGNLVIAGGLSPFGISTAVAPLAFMRDLLCVSDDPRPRPTCSTSVHFDIWAAHPYTAGGPTHRVAGADDVSVAQLPEMKTVAGCGRPCRARGLEGPGPVLGHGVLVGTAIRPTPRLPASLEGWWVAEALYSIWSLPA